MPRTTHDGRLELDPHQYETIVAPLRPQKASTLLPRVFAVLWVLVVLLLWPMGERMAGAVGEAFYAGIAYFRDALGPS